MKTEPTPQAIERLWWLCAELETLADSGDLGYYAEHRMRELIDQATGGGPTNVVIAALVDALRVLTDGDLTQATAVLQAARPTLLTDQEYAQVMGWLGQRRRTCGNCGGVLLFVADGPQPGWWSHDLVPDEQHPCRGAVPEVTR